MAKRLLKLLQQHLHLLLKHLHLPLLQLLLQTQLPLLQQLPQQTQLPLPQQLPQQTQLLPPSNFRRKAEKNRRKPVFFARPLSCSSDFPPLESRFLRRHFDPALLATQRRTQSLDCKLGRIVSAA